MIQIRRHILTFAATLALFLPLAAQEPLDSQGEFSVSRAMVDRFREETRLVLAYMSTRHYNGESLDDISSPELLTAYMEELDYSKLFLVQDDVTLVHARFDDTLKGAYLVSGNLYPAFEVFRLYRQRALDRLSWVFERLQGEFDLTTDETYRPDRKDLDWPATATDADQLWERRLKYEVLQELLDDESLQVARERLTRRYERMERFLKNIEPHEVEEMFLNSFTGLYDPHSNFFSVESTEDFTIQISNSLQGIGAVLTDEDGYCVIRELIPGGPAELSGRLNPGDRIVAVSQAKEEEPTDVVDMKLSKVVKLIRGTKGSEVRLTVLPAGETSREIVTLVRDEIQLTEKLAKATLIEVPSPETGSPVIVGVIDLPSFYGGLTGDADASSTSRDVEELLLKLQALGVDGIVLDLRRNGGGLLSESVRLTGLFIDKGPVVQVKYLNGKVRSDWDEDPRVVYTGPLVVLVSRNSASASEITAGALQALGRAVIVGDRTTHGKGTVQQPVPLNDLRTFNNPFRDEQPLGMIKITVQRFYLPDGASTQKEGVHSDIVLPSINELLPIGEADLDHALPWDTIEPVPWRVEQVFSKSVDRVSPGLLANLRERSQERLSTLQEFDYLKTQIDRFAEKDEKKDISLNLAQRKVERAQDKEFRSNMDKLLDQLDTELSYPQHPVRLALAQKKEAQHQEQLREVLLPNGQQRANSYYQKVYYYTGDDNIIHPVNVELFDYERLQRHSADIAVVLSEVAGQDIPAASVDNLLHSFQISDRGSDFQVEATFEQHLPTFAPDQIAALLPAFYDKLVDLDPQIVSQQPKLDIFMREACRVVADWVDLEHSPLSRQTIADTAKPPTTKQTTEAASVSDTPAAAQ